MQHSIDATGRTLGRVASDVAVLLRGKSHPSFERHLMPTDTVTVTNAGKLKITEQRAKGTTYRRHSHFPGGEKKETLAQLRNRKGVSELLRKAVWGMLPHNRLRSSMMNNLTIKE